MLLKKKKNNILAPTFYSQAPSTVKKYIDLCFSHYLHQLIMEPTRTPEHTKTLIDHIRTNSPEKVIQTGVIETRLSDHELIYCSMKVSLLKLNEHYEISFRSMKSYSDEIFKGKLRSIKFPDYSNHICVNDAYQDFFIKFLSTVDSVLPIRTLRVKSNIKPWFDIDVLNAFKTVISTIKNSNNQARELIKTI